MKIVIKIFLAFLTILAADIYAQNIYWTDGVAGKIQSASQAGASLSTPVSGIGSSYGIAADLTNSKIYWVDNTDKSIKRANLDGSNVATVVTQASGSIGIPRGLALNVEGNKMYWTDNGTGRLMSSALDGSSVTVLVDGLECPGYVAYDPLSGKIYWADNGTATKEIKRCNSDASGVETVVTGLGQVWGIALSAPDMAIYWIDSQLGSIRKGSLNSLPVTPADVVTGLTGSQRGLVIDKRANYMFWSNTLNQIVRARLDGTEQTVIVSGLTNPQGLAINYDSALPVELMSFTAASVQDGIMLNWSTSTEINNNKFEVERKSGQDWIKAGEVLGSGNSNSRKDYSFTDAVQRAGRYSYRLKQIDNDGTFKYSNTVEVEYGASHPEKFELKANYPNPFNPATTLSYQLADVCFVQLKVYDVLGGEVAVLVNEKQDAGSYSVRFDASQLPSGMYIARLNTDKYSKSIKMELVK